MNPSSPPNIRPEIVWIYQNDPESFKDYSSQHTSYYIVSEQNRGSPVQRRAFTENTKRKQAAQLIHFNRLFNVPFSVKFANASSEDVEFLLLFLTDIEKKTPQEDFAAVASKFCALLETAPYLSLFLAELGCYLYARDKGFQSMINQWEKNGIVSLVFYWSDLFANQIIAIEAERSQREEEQKAQLAFGFNHQIVEIVSGFILTQEGEVKIAQAYAMRYIIQKMLFGRHIPRSFARNLEVVLTALIEDEQLRAKFATVQLPHPSYDQEILIALKLPIDTQITPNLFKQSLLQALLTDIRQKYYQGNCYAIAAINWSRIANPCLLFDLLYGLFTEEKLAIGRETFPVCLSKIWQAQHQDRRGLLVKVRGKDIVHNQALQKACASVGVFNFDLLMREKRFKLKKVFKYIKMIKGEEAQSFAKKVYFSFKDPNLLRIATYAIEFYLSNSDYPISADKFSLKHLFLYHLQNRLREAILPVVRDIAAAAGLEKELRLLHAHFFYHTLARLQRYFWVIDLSQERCEGTKHILMVEQNGERRIFHIADTKKANEFRDYLCHYYPTFCNETGEHQDLSSLSSIKSLMRRNIEDITESLREKGCLSNEQVEKITKDDSNVTPLSDAFTSSAVIMNTEYLESKEDDLDSQFFKEIDFYSFRHIGHFTNPILAKIFNCNFSVEYRSLGSAKDFFPSLSFFSTLPEVLFTTSTAPCHQFILFPKMFSEFLQDENARVNFVESPGMRILDRPLSEKKKKWFLSQINLYNIEVYQTVVDNFNYTARDFKRYITSKLTDSSTVLRFENLFNNFLLHEEGSTIANCSNHLVDCFFNKFPNTLDKNLIVDLKYALSTQLFQYPYSNISHSMHGWAFFIEQWMRPFALAPLDPYDIEKMLCDIFVYPHPIILGDLNHEYLYKEKHAEEHLVMAFDFITERVEFFKRSEEGMRYYFDEDLSEKKPVDFCFFIVT